MNQTMGAAALRQDGQRRLEHPLNNPTLHRFIFFFCVKRIGRDNWHDAEEIAQTALLTVVEKFSSETDPETLRRIAWGCAKFAISSYRQRRESRDKHWEPFDDQADQKRNCPPAMTVTVDVHRELVEREDREKVFLAIDELNSYDRHQIDEMLAGKTFRDIAANSGTGAGTALQRRRVAVEKLRQKIFGPSVERVPAWRKTFGHYEPLEKRKSRRAQSRMRSLARRSRTG